MVSRMGLGQEVLWVYPVMTNQAQQSGAVAPPVLLSHRTGRSQIHPQVLSHIVGHSLIDLGHDPKAGVVQGVVQIDQPETRRCVLRARFSQQTSQTAQAP
jgi:hypothetical protein